MKKVIFILVMLLISATNFYASELKIYYPAGGEKLTLYSNVRIKWEVSPSINEIRILAFNINTQSWNTIIDRTGNNGSFDWIIDRDEFLGKLVIRIEDAENPNNYALNIAYTNVANSYPKLPEYSANNNIYDIKVSPNPVEGRITFSCTSTDKGSLYIYNIEGIMIKKIDNVCNGTNIDFSELVPGQYLLTYLNNNKYSYSHFIKN